MNTLLRLFLSAVAVLVLGDVLKGVVVENYVTAIIVALVISILNLFVKPVLVILTLPITIITLGLFLFVINALIILLADKLIDGFSVNGILTALLFSILLSLLQSLLHSFLKTDKKKQ